MVVPREATFKRNKKVEKPIPEVLAVIPFHSIEPRRRLGHQQEKQFVARTSKKRTRARFSPTGGKRCKS
jgi:hypothetical protein